MKQRKCYTMATVLVFIASFSLAAVTLPIVIDPEFPYAILKPSAPTMDDSVALEIIIGNSSNNCASPYLATFRIVQISDNVCVRAPCPQEYLIKVGYRPSPYQTDVICPMIAGPYGPTCQLGKLNVGSYTVDVQIPEFIMTT